MLGKVAQVGTRSNFETFNIKGLTNDEFGRWG